MFLFLKNHSPPCWEKRRILLRWNKSFISGKTVTFWLLQVFSTPLVLWGHIAGNVCIHISEMHVKIRSTSFYVQMRVKGLCASLGSGGEPSVMPIVLHVHIYYLLIIIYGKETTSKDWWNRTNLPLPHDRGNRFCLPIRYHAIGKWR